LFDPEYVLFVKKYIDNVRLVLALPETGALAISTVSSAPFVFELARDVVAEGTPFVVTKSRLLVTPIIKYETNIAVQWLDAMRMMLS
jgi:hypothetical protein